MGHRTDNLCNTKPAFYSVSIIIVNFIEMRNRPFKQSLSLRYGLNIYFADSLWIHEMNFSSSGLYFVLKLFKHEFYCWLLFRPYLTTIGPYSDQIRGPWIPAFSFQSLNRFGRPWIPLKFVRLWVPASPPLEVFTESAVHGSLHPPLKTHTDIFCMTHKFKRNNYL